MIKGDIFTDKKRRLPKEKKEEKEVERNSFAFQELMDMIDASLIKKQKGKVKESDSSCEEESDIEI